MEEEIGEETGASVWVWIGLILIAMASFWCQATVTEERFVPALNVVATVFNIPDDVAGATLMAAGASSPELFSSFVSLFVTHSSLGLGTIVGSEIFNQLIICAGAVWASKSGTLELDPAILTREVGFYALSILLLYLALQDVGPDPDDPSGEEHIFISFGESFMVFAGYIAYVWVCGNMDAVVTFVKNGYQSLTSIGARGEDQAVSTRGRGGSYGSIGTPSSNSRRVSLSHISYDDVPFLREKDFLTQEPVGNFREVSFGRTISGERHSRPQEVERRDSSFGMSLRGAVHAIGAQFSEGASIRNFSFLLASRRPTLEHGLHEVERGETDHGMSCFMWQRSYFYTKARFATHGWHLRWFTLTATSVQSVPDRRDAERHVIKYPKLKEIEVDETRQVVRLIPKQEGRRDFYLMAPSLETLEEFVVALEKILENYEAQSGDTDDKADENFDSGDDFESLIEFPSDGSTIEMVMFVLLFPLRFLMHWTCPDVRLTDINGNPTSGTGLGVTANAFLACFACLLWLIVGSYAMVASLEALADLMNVPDAVVGVTVSAAGTSLPNYVASKVAAEQGFGNMAVSNAFGSNTFNIMIGLGFPWVIYTSFGTGFQPYHGLRNEGILESVLVMAFVLLVFVLIVIVSRFKLHAWHGNLFVGLYVAYLAFAIIPVYVN